MQNNSASISNQVRTRPVRSGGATKRVRKIQTRKIPYRVGYTWNKGGRLKELRIRQLARKFLKIWMKNTFGRILPHEARFYYNSVVLRRTFEGWRDEWWASRREWSLTVRAECHYRYYLFNWTFQSWRNFISLQSEKRAKMQSALSLADRRLKQLVWDRWRAFIEMRRMQNRTLESVLAQRRVSTIHLAWNLWQTRVQQEQHLKQRALNLQRKAWVLWREMHRSACCQKEKESKAAFHFTLKLKRRTFHQWINYVSCRQTKKKTQAVAQRACYLRLMGKCWRRWNISLNHSRSEETLLQAASHLTVRSIQHRVLIRWKAYMSLCREENERNQKAAQHFHHLLMRSGLQGLSLNVMWNKAHRLNNNIAVQHFHQTMISKYLKLWRDHLEEAEDQKFQPLTEMALTNYRISLLRICFHHWREKLVELRHMQELERCADILSGKHLLSRCFKSWVDFTLQRRVCEHRRHKADVYNRQRQYTWVFYTWQKKSKKQTEEMLSERMAILHKERCHMQRAWTRWRQSTQQQIKDAGKQKALHRLYLHRLLHNTMMQWKDNSCEIRDRRNRERQACYQGDLRCMRLAVDKWKKYVQSQRVKKNRMKEIQQYHEVKLLQNSFVAWKKHHLHLSLIYEHAEELYRQRTKCFLRKFLIVWREKAALLAEIRTAQNHFQHSLQHKVFFGWRKVTAHAVLRRHQQGEALSEVQQTINQVVVLHSFRRWRNQTREAQRERMNMEKARWHHNSKLLYKTLKAWSKHHHQLQKNKVMKRQGILLLKLKVYQTYFEQWKMKLQHRRREAQHTERALWHWSLTLQAKVLYGWRMWVTEQHSKREQAVRAAQVYRDQLLREGVTCILTYAAYMNNLTTDLTKFSQEQRSQTLQRVVKRCAMRWKQRALCKPQKEQEVQEQPAKKSVTFCLPASTLNCISSTDSVEQGSETSHQSTLISTEPYMSTVDLPLKAQNQDLLMPPSAFMVSGTQNTLGKSSRSCPGEPLLVPFHQAATPFNHLSSAYPDEHLRALSQESEDPCVEDSSTDPISALTRELHSIQLDLKSFQRSRHQLRAWRKLREVLQNWLQMSGEDEQTERNAVCEELKELDERILGLSTELDKQKPAMLLHAERIQHLQSVLRASGVQS
ncbi:protein SFI1 homolog [Melanotaenia boesemani]|uniref:protein SFI1 homolog n=1 Tax=Melanotaenia boesemani TaxID=1250792 RepID=UPI001C04D585|nr:protein SFI1 homolog [Melanotaenia boesemani]